VRLLAAVVAALTLLGVARPAAAFVVEVTTSVVVTDTEGHTRLKSVVQTAVDDVLKDAIAFTPTFVLLTRAVVLGDRLYIRLLVADQEGEQTVKDLADPEEDPAPSASSRTDI